MPPRPSPPNAPTTPPLDRLLAEIAACRHCAAELPFGPRPVLQAHRAARLRIIGQAPGRKVHDSGIPWHDASGDRLRDWLGVTPAQFYDREKVALVPMGFCYPGKGRSGDLPPRPACAALWHAKLQRQLRHVGLTLLVGRHAQAYYLGDRGRPTLAATVRAWPDYLVLGYFPLPHPSPRNQLWLKKNPWFAGEVLPALRRQVDALAL